VYYPPALLRFNLICLHCSGRLSAANGYYLVDLILSVTFTTAKSEFLIDEDEEYAGCRRYEKFFKNGFAELNEGHL
jgi:hypothetical protein